MVDLSTRLGKPVSSFVFGVMQFGGKADEGASQVLFDAARAGGITAFDAAYVYTDGAAETLLGKFAAREREALTLISKVYSEPGTAPDTLVNQALESVERLRTDAIDILYLHRYPGDEALHATLEAMRDLYVENTFHILGVSNFAAWQVMKAQAAAEEVGAPRIEMLQPMYNLVKRQAEVEILPMAQAEGLGVHAYSPLGGGLLTGKYARGDAGRLTQDAMYKARYAPDWMHRTATDLSALAAETGHTAEALAVAWVAAHPGVTAPIVSASAPDQLAPSLAAAQVEMTPELYARLSALSPTPPPATDRLEEA
ncbi:MAG: aldo/keto reductase [Pseudomonadota bacterium]